MSPGIQALPDRRIAHLFFGLGPPPVQDVLDLKQPLVQALDLRQWLAPGGPLGHNGLQARQLLCHKRAHGPPFFPSHGLAGFQVV